MKFSLLSLLDSRQDAQFHQFATDETKHQHRRVTFTGEITVAIDHETTAREDDVSRHNVYRAEK